MKELDEETALAIVFANTRRKKRTENLLTIAEAFDFLKNRYGTVSAVAQQVGLSQQMIREFLSVLELPKEVRALVRKRLIDSVDAVYKISHLPKEKQLEAAVAAASLPAGDVRDIERLSKSGKLSVGEAKIRVLEAKPRNMHIFLIDVDDLTYEAIRDQAKETKIKPAELIKKIITENVKVRGGAKT